MDFSEALSRVKQDDAITRPNWNAQGQYVVSQAGYPDGIAINENTARATHLPPGTVCRFQPYLMLHNAQGNFVPWAPSMGDLFADDWEILAW
jgi:hypothetical protein